MTTILITGSEGGIARHIRPVLRSSTLDNLSLLLSSRRSGRPLGTIPLGTPLDYIVHTAAPPWPPRKGPIDTYLEDVHLTERVIELARASQRPTHVLYLSSMLVYGRNVKSPMSERDDRIALEIADRPVASAKLAGEELLHAMRIEHNRTTYTAMRLANVVTHYEAHDHPGHLIIDLYRKIFVHRQTTIELRNSRSRRAFTLADDVAEACRSLIGIFDTIRHARGEALANAVIPSQTINIGSSEPPITALELAQLLIARGHELGLLPASYEPVIEPDGIGGDDRWLDVTKAADLGITCPTPISRCIDLFLLGKDTAAKMPA